MFVTINTAGEGALEAASGLEPLHGALRAPALPLGYTAWMVPTKYYTMRSYPGKTIGAGQTMPGPKW